MSDEELDEDLEVLEQEQQEEDVKEPSPPVVTISRTVSVDAKQSFGDGKRIAVKSNQTGIRISYTKRGKANYGGYGSSTDSVVIPHQYFNQVYDILTAVREAQNGNE